MDDGDNYFTNLYSDCYGDNVIKEVMDLFSGNKSIVESFFAVHAQIDLLVRENDISLYEAKFRDLDEWRLEQVLACVDEIVQIAKDQKSLAWVQIRCLVKCMREMAVVAKSAPENNFVQSNGSDPFSHEDGVAKLIAFIYPGEVLEKVVIFDESENEIGFINVDHRTDGCRDTIEQIEKPSNEQIGTQANG